MIPKSNPLRKWLTNTVIILAALNLLIYFADVTYVYRALWYNFAGIDDHLIFENRAVRAGVPDTLPVASDYNRRTLPEELSKKLSDTRTVAFLVLHNDSVSYEQYREGYGPSSYSNSFSVAKSIVGILAGIALQEGYLKNLDEPVGKYLPGFSTGEKAKITIRHLLTMSSGLNWQESYMLPVSHTTEAYYGRDLQKLIGKLKVIHAPGTRFRYKSGDTQILGLVLAKATGMSLTDYASEKLWKPLHASANALWSTDREGGTEKAYCCFFSNARDFARIGLLYLHRGNWNGLQVVPEEYVNASLAPVMIPGENGIPADHYGYQWWLAEHEGEKVFYARGILGQFILIIPSKNLVVVRLGHAGGEKTGNHYSIVLSVLKNIWNLY